MTYSNVNDFIVILADDRDPDVSFRNHRKRGSYGGVDCVASLGTPIYAPDDCILINYPNNGSGGNTIQLRYLSGAVDEMMHLSQFVESGAKAKGALVGYSGDTGSPGQPHVHWHRIGTWYQDAWGGTNRYNPFHYFEPEPEGIKNMSNLRVITCPSWRAAKVQAVHNGSTANLIQDVEALTLRQGGVEYKDYENDYEFTNEINIVHMLGGLEADAAASATHLFFAKASNV